MTKQLIYFRNQLHIYFNKFTIYLTFITNVDDYFGNFFGVLSYLLDVKTTRAQNNCFHYLYKGEKLDQLN